MRWRTLALMAPLAGATAVALVADDPELAAAAAAADPDPPAADEASPLAGRNDPEAPTEGAPEPTRAATPGVDKLTCDATLGRIHAALERADQASWRPDQLSELVLVGRHAVDLDTRDALDRQRSRTCAARAVEALRASPTCGSPYGAVASGLFGADRFPSSTEASLLERARSPECRTRLVQSAQFSANVDDRLAADVERLTASDADGADANQSAWFALGSIELAARRHGQARLANRLDGRIARSLHASSGERRLLLLGVAGNAACRACEPDLLTAANDDDVHVRRAAAGAWRFDESAEAVRRMCDPLLGDADADVREHAAWSLRWSDVADQDRVECLVTAAATDESLDVRKSAALSLTLLAPRSALARSGLRHLTSPEYPGEIENIARSYLLALGPVPGDELRLTE